MRPDRGDAARYRPAAANVPCSPHSSFATLQRFLPYLWPADAPGLKARIVGTLLLVLPSIEDRAGLGAGYALKAAVDSMTVGDRGLVTFVVLMVIGYAAARLGTTLFDNVRQSAQHRVRASRAGGDAAAGGDHLPPSPPALAALPSRRRTGAITKVVERGTKSIDSMLYFLLFNIAPTILELALVLQIFGGKFGWWLVASTMAMVVIYTPSRAG